MLSQEEGGRETGEKQQKTLQIIDLKVKVKVWQKLINASDYSVR